MDGKKKMIALAIVAILVVGTVGVAYAAGFLRASEPNNNEDGPIEITQTDGTTVTLPGVAERIVVLNVNSAEMVYILGAGDKVVGASSATLSRAEGPSMFPNAVNLGSSVTPNTEVLATLDADVIVAFSTLKLTNQAAVEALGIVVVYIDCYILGTIDQDVRSLAKIVGDTERGEQYINFVKIYTDLIDSRIKNVPASNYPTTYVEFSSDYAAQANGTSSDVILGVSGGVNIAHDLAYGSKVSAEWIVDQDPEYIFKILSSDIVGNDTAALAAYNTFVGRVGFSEIQAVEDHHVYLVRNDLSYGPRGFVSVLIFAKAFYPNVFADVNIQEVLEEYNAEFDTVFNTSVTTYQPSAV